MLLKQYFPNSYIVLNFVTFSEPLKFLSIVHARFSKVYNKCVRVPMIESRVQLWKGGVLRRRNLHQSTTNTVN
jgi:hypothetical protein